MSDFVNFDTWLKNLDTETQKLLKESTHRFWVFTSYEEQPPDHSDCRYMIYQRERGKKSGKLHWQGYLELSRGQRLSWVRKNVFPGQSKYKLKRRFGSQEQARAYCMKEDTRVEIYKEFGKLVEQGERTDIKRKCSEITQGVITVEDILLDDPIMYHQYGRTLEKVQDLANRKKFRLERTECIWYYGETATGKSTRAFQGYTPETHYVYPNDNGWWDGYKGQEVVILNDFRGEIPYNQLLQMIDIFPYVVRRRNKEPHPFISKKVIITSSLTPERVYHNRQEEDSIAQLLRRMTVIHCVKSPNFEQPNKIVIN